MSNPKRTKGTIMLSLVVILDTESEVFEEEEEGKGESEYKTYKVRCVDLLSSAPGGVTAAELKPDAPDGPYQVWKVICDQDNDFAMTLEAGSI